MTDRLDATGDDVVDDDVDHVDAGIEASGDPTDSSADVAPAGGRRVSKWDRPPEPHDWRFFVGNLGKVLIATGVLMFGFVAYQLWGTGIETARAQNQLENQFEELLAEFAAEPTAGVSDDDGSSTPDDAPGAGIDDPAGVSDDVSDGGSDGGSDDGSDGDTADDVSDDVSDDASDGDADVEVADGATDAAEADVPVAVDLSDEAVEQEIPPIVRGDVLARLEIPAIDRTDYVVPGVSLNDLKSGPGHYPDTPLPGQLGNSAIAGHRTTYGAPFFDVDQLGPNDEIVVTMANGDRFVYLVTGVDVVAASDYWVVTTTDPDIAELTLTSCHPKYTARDRIVVHSVLDPARSSNVGVPTFYELEPVDDPIPGDDPVVQDDEPVSGGPAGPEGEQPADGDSATGEPATRQPPPSDDVAVGEAPVVGGSNASDGTTSATDDDADRGATLRGRPSGQVEDAFGQGWFDDMDAWPQIALWGSALTVISLAAYAISRRFRHDSIGFLVGIGPFLFALYFFFQNVNRLLPPGL